MQLYISRIDSIVSLRITRNGHMVKRIRMLLQCLTNLGTKYPAVLSAYVIYSYLFISMIRLFLKVKFRTVQAGDFFDIFSALPFMWLLAVSLVKIIETRNTLHEIEKQRLLDSQQLQMKETQLATMKEVVRGLQHHINNPLAIISLSTTRLKRAAQCNRAILESADEIEYAYKRIGSALMGFSESISYDVEGIDPVVGNMAVPSLSPN